MIYILFAHGRHFECPLEKAKFDVSSCNKSKLLISMDGMIPFVCALCVHARVNHICVDVWLYLYREILK